ncbi:MAG: hypothetical protein V1743_04895, partial [Nanoarchaeota archaeon]
DEIERLKKERLVKHMYTKTPGFIKKYFIPVIGGFIIASPLPDEIGISLFAASTKISTRVFSIMSYVLNTIGIFIILAIGTTL